MKEENNEVFHFVNSEDSSVELLDDFESSKSDNISSTESNFHPVEQTNSLSNYKKYNGYKDRMIRYSAFIILSLLLLLICLLLKSSLKNNTSTYSENSNVSYQVCLMENDYYKDRCIGEDLEYISSVTDVVRVSFDYTILSQTPMNKSYTYYIKSRLQMRTDDDLERELLNKEEKLLKNHVLKLNGNVATLSETVDIPFQKYNNYAQKYKNDYSLSSNGDLVVSLILKEKGQEKEISSITIPLTKLTYSITKKDMKEKVTEFVTESNNLVSTILLIGIILGIIFVIISFLLIILFLWKTRRKKSKYEKKLKQILNTYDRVIITIESKNTIINDQEVYKVKSFLELLDVRDTIEKPILYYKVNDIKSEFYVQDINKTYKFTLKESDFLDS